MDPNGPKVQPIGDPEPPPRGKSPSSAIVVAAIVVGVLTGVWFFQAADDSPGESVQPVSPSVLETSTTGPAPVMPDVPWTLMFDDGLDGVVVVDPNDPQNLQEAKVEGQRAGDQPYRLELVGGHLIVGWEEIYAVEVDSADSLLLADSTIYVPAAEPDRVWMIDYSGGAIGSGTLTAWQVSVLGEEITPHFEVDLDADPVIGVPRGLALYSDSGIQVWDAVDDVVLGSMGSGPGVISDSTFRHGGALAWCEVSCEQIHVTGVPDMTDVPIDHPDEGVRFISGAARFSGDGRYLAAPAESGDLVVFDRESGVSSVVFDLPSENPTSVDWSESGHELFAVTPLQSSGLTRITHHLLGTDGFGTVDVSLARSVDFVVVPEGAATSFLAVSETS
jgi:hypothetical protein